LRRFDNLYNTLNGRLNLEPVVVPLSSQLRTVFQNAAAGGHYGLVFHYGYNETSGTLLYMMSRGQIYGEDSLISYCPLVRDDGSEYFYLMENGVTSNEINSTKFTEYTTAYAAFIKRNGTDLSYSTKDPQMVYHRASGFQKLLSAFNAQSPTHLYIGHIALPHVTASEARHLPCFALGNSSEFFRIDDNHNPQGSNAFTNKALDIGRLCPPNCPNTVLQCLQ
jgi:hypothetical protein